MYNINETITDLPTLFKEVGSQSTFLAGGILAFIWIFISLTGYYAQDRRVGRSSMPMWLTIGGFFTTMLSFILFLMDGIVNLYVVVTTLVLFIVFAGWFIFSGER